MRNVIFCLRFLCSGKSLNYNAYRERILAYFYLWENSFVDLYGCETEVLDTLERRPGSRTPSIFPF
ncbi:hypothetical protein L211DRAFT_834025 [Terfezia boudieri ATCC MYA-4762]|uniref:Uncharacterized protein n=1 Tax=Terfezia boudieri ATCC MYA-4762 TaxID=1051890 RepID=A0A3N4MGV2_9PEZI|nr:hypothetical protein L211DRAFT_834025 [Terfezia boudieri ATCC MYA-4762]